MFASEHRAFDTDIGAAASGFFSAKALAAADGSTATIMSAMPMPKPLRRGERLDRPGKRSTGGRRAQVHSHSAPKNRRSSPGSQNRRTQPPAGPSIVTT